jgi:hypothetical protein
MDEGRRPALQDDQEELERYASVILGRNVLLPKTPERIQRLRTQSKNIYQCPYRNNGRDYDRVEACFEKSVMDEGLHQLIGGTLNDQDVFVKDTCWWDVEDPLGRLFEVKSFKDSWLSWKNETFKTFIENSHKIDYLVAGRIAQNNEIYCVRFNLVIVARKFGIHMADSMTEGYSYYNHKFGRDDGHCIYRE